MQPTTASSKEILLAGAMWRRLERFRIIGHITGAQANSLDDLPSHAPYAACFAGAACGRYQMSPPST